MTKEQIEEMRYRRLSALALKEELAAEKMKLEIEKLKQNSRPRRFYNDPSFLRPVIAGLSIAIIFSAYFQYVFVPTQNRLIQKAESAEFQLAQSKSEHAANLAQGNLVREQIRQSSEEFSKKLKLAIANLEEAQRQNKSLSEQIASLPRKIRESENVVAIQRKLKESNAVIDFKLGDTQETQLKVDGFQKAAADFGLQKKQEGWIYVGYFPNGKWGYRTLELRDDEVVEAKDDKKYTLIQNVNIRHKAPTFSLLGYDFGDAIASVKPPRQVIIKETKTVGFSKLWARVVTVQ